MSHFAPRFQGRAIRAGKAWTWELFITIGPESGENTPICMTSKTFFINKNTAIADMKARMPDIIRETVKAMGHESPDGLMDLKAGTQESLEEWEKRNSTTKKPGST